MVLLSNLQNLEEKGEECTWALLVNKNPVGPSFLWCRIFQVTTKLAMGIFLLYSLFTRLITKLFLCSFLCLQHTYNNLLFFNKESSDNSEMIQQTSRCKVLVLTQSKPTVSFINAPGAMQNRGRDPLFWAQFAKWKSLSNSVFFCGL